jgi:spermidine synthase
MGFLTLFLELALIRYLSANIWNLGYFPNLVLLAAFIGMGAGFVLHRLCDERRSLHLFAASSALLLGLVAFVALVHPTMPGFGGTYADFKGEVYFSSPTVSAGAGTGVFVVTFGLVGLLFCLLSQRTARLFCAFEPLTAYTLDIAGSCAGIMLFMLVSFMMLPAWGWFAMWTLVYMMAAPMPPALRLGTTVCLFALVSLVAAGDARLLADPSGEPPRAMLWSPYQKLELADRDDITRLWANGIVHQRLLPLESLKHATVYAKPYVLRAQAGLPPYKRVLILGSGTGNDVMTALACGVEHVDAVEIDPGVYQIGRLFHEGAPYSDPRVNVILDDGRAYLERTTNRYDLIIFALTDSLVKVSDRAELRLENFLYSENSVARAYQLLNPHGDLLFYNLYRSPFVPQKIAQMSKDVSGHWPRVIFQVNDFGMLLVGPDDASAGPPAPYEPDVDVPTDDWPFLYVKRHALPRSYLAPIGVVVLASMLLMAAQLYVSRQTGVPPQPLALKAAFAWMGTAFLLLETKSVVLFSLLFGTTWLNNSLVFLGILLLVLAANWTAARWKVNTMAPIFALLMVASLMPLVVPLSGLLLIHSVAERFVVASLLIFAPIYLANLIFSMAFREQPAAEQLFGWNLLGAALGGVAEYAGLAFGYGALAVLVALCYAACWACLRRGLSTAAR